MQDPVTYYLLEDAGEHLLGVGLGINFVTTPLTAIRISN
jgi:hypothetical protein